LSKTADHATHSCCDKTDDGTQQQGADCKWYPIHIADAGDLKKGAGAEEILLE
jgi:hypothetical protein